MTLSHQLNVFTKSPLPLLKRHQLVDNAERHHGRLGHLKGKQLAHQRDTPAAPPWRLRGAKNDLPRDQARRGGVKSILINKTKAG